MLVHGLEEGAGRVGRVELGVHLQWFPGWVSVAFVSSACVCFFSIAVIASRVASVSK
jgi:hypothetical protein